MNDISPHERHALREADRLREELHRTATGQRILQGALDAACKELRVGDSWGAARALDGLERAAQRVQRLMPEDELLALVSATSPTRSDA